MNRQQRRQANKSNPPSPAASFLSALEGHRIAGGCDDCDAYQTMDATQAPMFTLRVHHDDSCPTFRAMTAPNTNHPNYSEGNPS